MYNDSPPPYVFAMPVKTDEYDEEDGDPNNGLYALLKFTLTPKYPEEAPEIEVEECDNLDGEVKGQLIAHLKEQVRTGQGIYVCRYT